jgi:purine-binding chemotaxis protein CheW
MYLKKIMTTKLATSTVQEETYLIAQIDQITFAVPASQVLHISRVPRIKKIPNADPSISGTISFRDTVISTINLRHFLGYETLEKQAADMSEMLNQRKSEHIHWLNEFERCIKSGEEFSLQTDPTLCKFGKWFYSFKTDNKSLQLLLQRFEGPHNTIHGIAKKAFKLVEEDRKDEAIALVEATKSKELQIMIGLFDEFEKAYEELTRSLVVVLWAGSQTVGFTVDSVSSVIRLRPISNDEKLDVSVSNALKEYGEYVFLHEDKIIYELRPETVTEAITGIY